MSLRALSSVVPNAVLAALFGSVLGAGAACGDDPALPPDAPGPIEPTANPAREILDTKLAFDVTALTGTASITFAASDSPGATLETGDLVIERVEMNGTELAHAAGPGTGMTASTLDLALPPSDVPLVVDIAFRYKHHTGFQGAHPNGYTLLWPYYCGNLFPCHSRPDDGLTMSLELTGVPADKVAVYPTTLSEAPSYQLAWSIDAYTETTLGTTTAGTEIAVWHRESELTAAQTGTTNLVAVFDWLEKTLGPYRFGKKAGSVSVRWGTGALGGMEHHPMWHVASGALAGQEVHAHEAAHGWYGDGIRIACWEDFVLSEGTTTYLAGRALDVVAPSVGAQIWTGYTNDLARIPGTEPVWPEGCNEIDILDDGLFTDAPYIRGAFFYRAVALKVGADVLDDVLASFYRTYAGKAARMSDMLDTIRAETGYDPTTCAEMWLRSTTKPAANTACP
jgi:aminopeptidase N